MRFKYYLPSQIIEDTENGRRYYGNKQVADLLNELADENEQLKQNIADWETSFDICKDKNEHSKQQLKPIQRVCDKYRIPLKDLPEILEEYIAYDNDDDW